MKKWTILVLLCLITTQAQAINLQKFHFSNNPTYATVEDGLLSEGFVTTDYKYIFVGSYSYVRAPFIEIDGDERQEEIIEWMHTLNFGGAYRFSDTFQIGVSSFATYERAIIDGEDEEENLFALGDSVIDFKYKFFEENRFAASFTPRLLLPTGNEDAYTSNGATGYYIGFALDKAFSKFQFTLNLGHKQNTGAEYEEVDYRSQFHFSVGMLAPLLGDLDFTAELYRDTPYDSSNPHVPSEGNIGLRYNYSKDIALFGGIGVGSTDQSNSNDVRSYIGLKFFPSSKQKSSKILKEEERFGRLKLGESIYFDTGSSIIRSTEKTRLQALIEEIKSDIYISKLVIEGYASTIGNKERNLSLSERRSKSVKAYLIESGIEVQDIELVKYGSEKADKVEINKDIDRKVRIRVYRSR